MRSLLILFIIILISGCSPSDADIAAAIAKTEAARPTTTKVPTDTPSPTETLTNTPTNTPEPTSTPDVRIVIGEPIDFTLVASDFPDNFYLRRNGSTPRSNKELLSARGQDEGKAYLEATGRIGGWVIWHVRGSSTSIAPEEVQSYVILYETVEGPTIATSPPWDRIPENYRVINTDLSIGSWTRVTKRSETQSSGRVQISIRIEFIYRNIWASVYGWGWESDVNIEYLANLARIMLSKMEAADLANP